MKHAIQNHRTGPALATLSKVLATALMLGSATGFAAANEFGDFEHKLKRQLPGSYVLYGKLDDSSRQEVFRTFQEIENPAKQAPASGDHGGMAMAGDDGGMAKAGEHGGMAKAGDHDGMKMADGDHDGMKMAGGGHAGHLSRTDKYAPVRDAILTLLKGGKLRPVSQQAATGGGGHGDGHGQH